MTDLRSIPGIFAVAGMLLACGEPAPVRDAGAAAHGIAARGAAARSSAADGAGASGAEADRAQAPVAFADLDRIRAELAARRGRLLFVNFWATWCVPCVEELPDLAVLAREEGDGRAVFLGISLDAWVTGSGAETEDKVRRALAAAGVDYPNLVYVGDQDPLLEAFRLPGAIPYSVLYDSQGLAASRWEGQAPIEEVRREIAAAGRRGSGALQPRETAPSR